MRVRGRVSCFLFQVGVDDRNLRLRCLQRMAASKPTYWRSSQQDQRDDNIPHRNEKVRETRPRTRRGCWVPRQRRTAQFIDSHRYPLRRKNALVSRTESR